MPVLMEATENSLLTRLMARKLEVVAFAVPAAAFLILKQLHEPKNLFQAVSIVSQDPGEPWATLAELARTQAAVIQRAHIEMVALTALGIALLYFLFHRNRTRYVLMASAAATLAACWFSW